MCHGSLPSCCMAAGHGRAVCLGGLRRLHKGHCFRQQPRGRIAPSNALRSHLGLLPPALRSEASYPGHPQRFCLCTPTNLPHPLCLCRLASGEGRSCHSGSQAALAAAQVALLMDFVGVADALACSATAIDFALEKGARSRLPLRPESPQRAVLCCRTGSDSQGRLRRLLLGPSANTSSLMPLHRIQRWVCASHGRAACARRARRLQPAGLTDESGLRMHLLLAPACLAWLARLLHGEAACRPVAG